MIIDQKAEREIRKRQLYIAQAIFDLCAKNNISCFLVGGSLLGAVKDQDILPGDKDIDIGMLREEYEKFISLIDELPDDLYVLEARKDTEYNWLFAKVCQKGTKLQPKDSPLFGPVTGIFVDVIPYDFVNLDERKRKADYKRAKLLKWFMLLKEKPSRMNPKLFILSVIGCFWSRNILIQYFTKSKNKTNMVGNVVGGTTKDWFMLDEIQDIQTVSLGGHVFMAPASQRYLDINYPGWEMMEMVRNEFDNYEIDWNE